MILCRDLPSPLKMPVFIGVSAREVLSGDLPWTSYRPPVTPPLQDSTGSRRYICIRIPDGQLIDNTGEIDYGQLYAQVVYELQELKAPYWFNNEEVARIQQLNQERRSSWPVSASQRKTRL